MSSQRDAELWKMWKMQNLDSAESYVCNVCSKTLFYKEPNFFKEDGTPSKEGGCWCHGDHKEPYFICRNHAVYEGGDLPLSFCKDCAAKEN